MALSKTFLSFAAASVLSVFIFRSAGADVLLQTPTDEDWALLAYDVAGVKPPVDTWAAAVEASSSLDEFKRDKAAQALGQQISARFQKIKGTLRVKLNLCSRFDDYNSKDGEFDFDLTDATSVDLQRVFGSVVTIHLVNGGLAQAWMIAPKDAEKVIEITKGNRNVNLGMTLKLVAASTPVQQNDPISLDAKVIEYNITSVPGGRNLGHVVVR